MEKFHTGRALLALVAVAFVAPACNEILGIREGTLATSDGDGGASDGGASDGGASDGGASDGGAPDGGAPDSGMPTGKCPPYELPATCEAPYLSDDENCCVRGRSCQGGHCNAGRCEPVRIASVGRRGLENIAVDGDEVFWPGAYDVGVQTCRSDGGDLRALPKGPNYQGNVAVRGGRVFSVEWNGPFLVSVPRDGSSAAVIVSEVPSGVGAGDGFAVDGERAYWVMENPPSAWFVRIPLSGRAAPTPLALDAGAGNVEPASRPRGLAVDSQYVYWSDSGLNVIKRRALSTLDQNLEPAEVFVEQTYPIALALDELRVYWLGNGSVLSRLKDRSAAAETLAWDQGSAKTLIVDDRYAYWPTFEWRLEDGGGGGAVRRTLKDGSGPVEDLATGQDAPWGIAQDCTAVYWPTDYGDIMKVAK